jgi:hypothetical protein
MMPGEIWSGIFCCRWRLIREEKPDWMRHRDGRGVIKTITYFVAALAMSHTGIFLPPAFASLEKKKDKNCRGLRQRSQRCHTRSFDDNRI